MPPKPRSTVAATPHTIRFTAAEWALVVAQARAAGVGPSAWVRARALEDR